MKPPKKSAKFDYNLKSILKVKKLKENQEKEKLVQATKKEEEEKQKEQSLRDEQVQRYMDLTAELEEGATLNFQQIELKKHHIDQLSIKIEKQVEVRKEAEKAKEKQRKEVERSVQERQVFEKDRDKKKQLWRDIMKKEDNKFLDEVASTRYFRQQKEKENEIE